MQECSKCKGSGYIIKHGGKYARTYNREICPNCKGRLKQKRQKLWEKQLTFTEWTLSVIVEENARQIRFIDELLEELKT